MKLRSFMQITALVALFAGCPADQLGSHRGASGNTGSPVAASPGSLEICENPPGSKVKLVELSIDDFVVVAKQQESDSCRELSPCWSGMFAEEVPAQAGLYFRTRSRTVPCSQQVRVDITPIREAYLDGQRGGEFVLVIDGWGAERISVR